VPLFRNDSTRPDAHRLRVFPDKGATSDIAADQIVTITPADLLRCDSDGNIDLVDFAELKRDFAVP
jgi:hypothetical protein